MDTDVDRTSLWKQAWQNARRKMADKVEYEITPAMMQAGAIAFEETMEALDYMKMGSMPYSHIGVVVAIVFCAMDRAKT